MSGRPSLESVLYDIQAELRILHLLAEAEDDEDGWSRYGLPREEGFDLKRTPNSDAQAAWMTLLRLQRLGDLAISTFHART